MASRRLPRFAFIALFAAAVLISTQLVRAQEAPLAPQGLDALAARATLHSDVTFDESMLHAASQIMPDEDRPIIAKLRSITVHNFKYSAAGYDPAALDAVRAQYSGHGWNHLVTKQTHPPAEPAAGTAGPNAPMAAPAKPFDPTRTDVWARMDHGNFDGVVLLVANEHNINVVVVDGMISPLDLLHLRGHFGIPQFGSRD
ncbi:MAG: hypothetical protein WA476_22565 [Acidobacteriaceae bacterium]